MFKELESSPFRDIIREGSFFEFVFKSFLSKEDTLLSSRPFSKCNSYIPSSVLLRPINLNSSSTQKVQ